MIREATEADLPALTALCLAAKAHWGYDAAFMAACEQELTLRAQHLGPGLVFWEDLGAARGVVRVSVDGALGELEDLFVHPGAMGTGLGRRLFDWASAFARAKGAKEMGIDSDPFAEPFYAHMGARVVGKAPSGSIPGRMLPRMVFALT